MVSPNFIDVFEGQDGAVVGVFRPLPSDLASGPLNAHFWHGFSCHAPAAYMIKCA